jgi:hypothetical protein
MSAQSFRALSTWAAASFLGVMLILVAIAFASGGA